MESFAKHRPGCPDLTSEYLIGEISDCTHNPVVSGWISAWKGGTIEPMKQHDANRHPGPWRVMRVDSEFAGLLVAVGFVVMGLVSLAIAKWFLLGALLFGVGVALLLRHIRKG
jgi:hypothetical protein